jgi:hypothetical protein
MNKKKWALLIISCLVLIACFKLYYKRLQSNVVAASADYIAVVDVKKIINTIIWQTITTPSRWKAGNVFSKDDSTAIDWKDMVEIPDYIQIFHSKNQPMNIWYTVLTIKDATDFTTGLKVYDFIKISETEFESKVLGLHVTVIDNNILLSNAVEDNGLYNTAIKNELFTQKKYAAAQFINDIIATKSHIALGIMANSFLQNTGICTANFTNEQIEIKGNFLPKAKYTFTNQIFNYCDTSLCTVGFTQNAIHTLTNINDSTKISISNALNINTDSFFLQSNKQYLANITGFLPRIDSAITYAYDADFNTTEKVVVNTITEPAYQFTAWGNGANNILTYLQKSKKVEPTSVGNLVTVIPFVKSYCSVLNNAQLQITANNYTTTIANKKIGAIVFVQVLVNKIPASLMKYLPTDIITLLANIKDVQIKVYKNTSPIIVECILYKKNKALPYFGDF